MCVDNAVIGIIYASEVAPLPLRGLLSAFVMMCWATGQLIALGVLRLYLTNTIKWSFRAPFVIQWAWIPPIFFATIFCPDSHYWLVRKRDVEKAEKMVESWSHSSVHHLAKQRFNMMVYTNALEQDNLKNTESRYKGWRSYLECFKGINRRRTEISVISMPSQVLADNNFAYMLTYLFQQVGISSTNTYNLNLGHHRHRMGRHLCFLVHCHKSWPAKNLSLGIIGHVDL